MRLIACLALWGVWVGMSQWSAAEPWPNWRGPHHDGLTSETALPIEWGPHTNVLWKIRLDGVGHSSPIAWQDAIFVTSCDIDQQSRKLMRLDRETGKLVWSRILAEAPIEVMHRDNSPASATPVTDGKLVYTVFCVDGGLLVSAVSFDGEVQWSSRVGEFMSQHGFCASLVLDNGLLFVSGLQDGQDAFVAALEASSGQTMWKVPRPKQVRSYSTPFLCTIGNTPALMLSGAEQTITYDRQTGATLWELSGPGSKTVSSVVACPLSGLAFVCGGRDNNFFAIDLHQASGGSPRVAWTASKGIPYMTSPLVSNGKLHVLSDEGVYRCYEAASGRVLNERRGVGTVRASMVANQQHIYVTEVSGRTTVIENSEHWRVVAVNELEEQVVASMAVSDGDLLLRGQEHLFLIRDPAVKATR